MTEMHSKNGKNRRQPAVLLREKERKNEKGDIRFYAIIINDKCEDSKWKNVKQILSCKNIFHKSFVRCQVWLIVVQ